PCGPETENIFDDTFWENLNVVVNALDYVNARLYVDQRCLYFQKPLLESGTLGAKCNTQMVIPHLTENYGASRDPPEKQAPMFEDYFANRMKQLIFTFLEDAATSTDAPFWSAPKCFPRPLELSVSDLTHLNFVLAGSILRAETFRIPIPDWAKNPKKLSEVIDQVIVPDFQPKQGAKIETDENVTNLSSASIDYSAIIDELIKKLESRRKILSSGYDDDTNYHMDFIAGLANMRARNYSIPDVDKLRAKFIVGRIILAIATSTSMATGLVCLELYKVIDGGRKVEDYLNTFANLALPLFSMAELVPPKQQASLGYVFDPTQSTEVSSEAVSCSQGTVEPHGSIGALAGVRAITYVPDFPIKPLLYLLQKKNWLFIQELGYSDFMYQVDNREISSTRKEHMPYPRFTKVIINHFISKDKTISMRNRINLHTTRDDSLLGTLKFDFATGKATPKKERKYKNITSPSRKPSPVLEEEHAEKPKRARKPAKKSANVPTTGEVIIDTPRESVPKKNTPSKVNRGKGIDILFDASLLKAAQVKEALKKSKKDSHMLYASSSGDGVGSKPKGDNGDDGSNDDDSDELTKDDDEVDVESDANKDEEASDSEKTDFDDDKNLNHDKEMKGDTEMTDADKNVSQERTYEQVVDDAHVTLTTTQKTEGSMQSSSISFDFASKYLNLYNVPPVNNKVASMMNVKVLQEESSTLAPPLLIVLETAIPETTTIASMTDLFDSYGKAYSLKKGREDKEKDGDPPAGLDQGLKKRKTRKDDEPLKGFKSKDSTSSSSKGTKGDLGNKEDQPNVEEASKHDWFKKQERPPTSDRDWNAGKKIDFRLPQTWIRKMAKPGKPLTTFNELMSTPIDFSAYTNLEGHEYPFDLSKHLPLIRDQGRQVDLANYFFNNDLKYLKGGSLSSKYTTSTTKTKAVNFYGYASNKKSKHNVLYTKRINAVTHVEVVKKYDYGYLDEIIIRRKDHQLCKFVGDFPRLNLRDIQNMLLLLVQKKLSNLERDYLFELNVALRMFDITKMTPYTTYNNPQGIIYQDKFQRNRLMRSDKRYKFCDGTLSSVRRVLRDIASSLEMDYLPKRRRSKLDRKRSNIMIKAIDQQLFERRTTSLRLDDLSYSNAKITRYNTRSDYSGWKVNKANGRLPYDWTISRTRTQILHDIILAPTIQDGKSMKQMLVLLVYKVVAVFNKVNTAKSRVTTAVRVSTAGWIKRLEEQDMQDKELKIYSLGSTSGIRASGEYDLWLMRIKQYFLMTDYSLWEVIKNGNKVLTKMVGIVEQPYKPTTVEEKLDMKNEMKARRTLLMALPNKDQLKFHSYQDAKLLMEAIEKRYGGNKEFKNVQRTLLKQQYKNFAASSLETLDQTFDRLQILISQLEIQGEVIEQEDLNLKQLRSLISEWKTHALIWRNKAEIETISLDDFTNNTSNTNEADNTAYGVSTADIQGNADNSTSVDNLSDAVICAFLASQPNSSQLARKDLEQIDLDDLEEMDLKWDMDMLTISARRFIKRKGKNLDINGQKISFGRSKVECYNCHKNGHFARECTAPNNQENKSREYGRKIVPAENPTENALIAQDGIGGDNALDVYTKNLEKVEKEIDELKLTLENYQNSSKSLNALLESQVSDKDKAGLGYKAASPAIENFVNSSKMIGNQENVRSRSDKEHHAVPPHGKGRISGKGTKDNIVACQAEKKKEPEQEYILIPICTTNPLISQGPKDSAVDAGKKPTEVDVSQVLDNGGQDTR
nr:ubiquitin-activating enzyme E1 1-like isoform X2 [Tanacetum cinerariifolium]